LASNKLERQRARRLGDGREDYLAYQREYYRKNRTRLVDDKREDHLLRKDDMTHEDYEKMLEAQGGKCAGCGKSADEHRRHLDIDHNHETGEVRGLLCTPCNMYDVLDTESHAQ